MEEGSIGITRENRKTGLGGGYEGGVGRYCLRKLPSASAEVRGRPRRAWKEDGRWEMGNYEDKERGKLA